MLENYNQPCDDATFLQTANPTPSIDFCYDDAANTETTFLQTANPTPSIEFSWE